MRRAVEPNFASGPSAEKARSPVQPRNSPSDFQFISPSPDSCTACQKTHFRTILYHPTLLSNTAFQPNKGPVPGQIRPAPPSALVPNRTCLSSRHLHLVQANVTRHQLPHHSPNTHSTDREKGKSPSPITPTDPVRVTITLSLHLSSRPTTASPARQNFHPSPGAALSHRPV